MWEQPVKAPHVIGSVILVKKKKEKKKVAWVVCVCRCVFCTCAQLKLTIRPVC